MEGDNQNNKTKEAEVASAPSNSQPDDGATAAAHNIQTQDFSQPEQGSITKCPGEDEKRVPEALGTAPGVATARSGLGPGFVDISGDVGGSGHNETLVDIIAVPCPGADPVHTWIYDALGGDGNHPPDIGSRSSLRRPTPWVTKDLRSRVDIGRVFLYRHRALQEGMSLKSLSKDLLDQIELMRSGAKSRPLFFLAHSIGGLVVKKALVRASRANHPEKYVEIMENCHGVTFFGTPHRGSSYMSMPNLKGSIQELLQLEAPLPRSLTDEIRVRNVQLTGLHDQFVDMASELRLWSFYETHESYLSGAGAGLTSEVQFGAPLVSVKSALLDVWQEDVYAVESDHAHLAAFGPSNRGILESFLEDFGEAVRKAASISHQHAHTPLHLKSRVTVEVIGFYEDPDVMGSPRLHPAQCPSGDGAFIRLYATKYPFKDYLRKGPERCLAERLHKVPKRRGRRGKAGGEAVPKRSSRGLGNDDGSIVFYTSTTESSQSNTAAPWPEIVVTGPQERPPLLRAPLAQSEPTVRPASPESIASASTTMSDSAIPFASDYIGEGSHTVDLLAKQQAEILIKEHEFTGVVGFSRPNPSLRKFMWIHLPFNNPVWVKQTFATLARTQGRDFSKLFDYDNWVSKQIQNRNSESQPAYMKAICKYVSAAERLALPRTPSPFSPITQGIPPNCLYVYLPYLHFDTYRSMIQRRKLVAERRAHGRSKPVPENVAQMDSLELKVIWEYIGFDPPLNYRRTLDQFGHHSLHDTKSRDDDQMLYKLTKRDVSFSSQWDKSPKNKSARSSAIRSSASVKGYSSSSQGGSTGDLKTEPEADLKNGYVLMVDQLWLWSIDMTTLTTFFPRRESSPTEGTLFQQADLRNSVYNELNGDLTGRTENTFDLAALIVWHAVTVLLDRSSHPELEIFRLFDEAIGMLAERMTLSMKQFRMHAFDLESGNDDDDMDESDPEGESPAAIKKRHKRELERSERENRENTSALLELRDLEDELTTLQKLFDIQETTIHQMKDIYTSSEFKDITKNGQDYLDEALEYVEEYKQQTTEMLKRVDTTRNDYEKMLEMVQRQAQVDEVRWSRLQAELASSQNLSTMIFTTFTVIFLPLTFFTGLFGMNTIEWQEEDVPSLGEIGAISLPASILLILISLVAAFNWRMQGVFKTTYRGTKGAWKQFKGLLESDARKEVKKKRREDRKRRLREAQSAGNDDQVYDFWALVKKQQSNARYHIPGQNVNNWESVDGFGRRRRP